MAVCSVLASAPTLAQFEPAQSPDSIAEKALVAGRPRVESQLAPSAFEPSVHQSASGSSARLSSRYANALSARWKEAALSIGACHDGACSGNALSRSARTSDEGAQAGEGVSSTGTGLTLPRSI